MADQRISIDASAGALDGTEIVPLVRVGSPVTAGSFAIGTAYVILSVGTTDFTLIGAASNTVGVGFVATGAGSGTGTAGATSNLRSTAQTIADLASGGSGAVTLVGSHVASSSATLAFTGLTGDHWRIVGKLLIPASASDGLLRFGTGGGPTYNTSGYFTGGSVDRVTAALAISGFQVGTANAFDLSAGANQNTSGQGLSFVIDVVTDNANWVHILGNSIYIANSDSHTYATTFSGICAIAAQLTALEFLESSGNIASGKLSLYSVAD